LRARPPMEGGPLLLEPEELQSVRSFRTGTCSQRPTRGSVKGNNGRGDALKVKLKKRLPEVVSLLRQLLKPEKPKQLFTASAPT
jgi:hypothetical protein